MNLDITQLEIANKEHAQWVKLFALAWRECFGRLEKAFFAKLQLKNTFFRIYAAHKTHISARYVWTEAKTAIFLIKKEIFLKIRFETEEKCSCESRPSSRNEREELPEAVADIRLGIMKISWRNETSAKAATVQRQRVPPLQWK